MRFSFDRFDFIEPDAGTQRPAVIDAAGTLGWQQLAQAVEQWEQQALARGARRDEPLLITGHKETAFLVAILGCLRLGVPFVPVDVINPPERMARIATLVQAGLRYDAQARSFVDTGIAAQPLQEKSLAYIMFTSGSTGDPKGVQIGRESMGLFAGWIRDCLALGEAPVFMDQMLFSFDFSLFNWMGALVTGGACVLCARETIADRQAFAAYLARTHVNVWASTPSFVRQQLLDADFDQQHLPDLRVFVFGAESLTPTVAEALWSRFPQARIINSYGPTEATCSTTWVEIDPRCASARRCPSHRPGQALCRRLPGRRRDLRGRRPCDARLPQPPRPARHTHVHAQRQARLPHGRPGRDRRRGPGHLPRPARRPDQDARLPHRAGRGRCRAGHPARRARGAAVALKRPDGFIVRMIGFVDLDRSGPPGMHPCPKTWPDGANYWPSACRPT